MLIASPTLFNIMFEDIEEATNMIKQMDKYDTNAIGIVDFASVTFSKLFEN